MNQSDQPPVTTTVFTACLFRHLFNKDSKITDDTALIYGGVKFRPKMTLNMEDDTFIGTNATILVPKLTMEKGSQINAGAILFGKHPIHLSRNVVVGYNVVMGTSSDTSRGKHMNDASPVEEREIKEGPIYVGIDAFIGSNAVIMPGVTIGPRSVVGSECYVDKSVEAGRKLISIAGLYVNLERPK